MENSELSLLELYEKYLLLPLATVIKPSVLYDRHYIVQTGMSILPPDPHRHYTFDEFVEKYESDDKFKSFIIDEPKPLT